MHKDICSQKEKVERNCKGTADFLEVVPVPAEVNKPDSQATTAAGKDSYIEKVNQKINVIRGHTQKRLSAMPRKGQ